MIASWERPGSGNDRHTCCQDGSHSSRPYSHGWCLHEFWERLRLTPSLASGAGRMVSMHPEGTISLNSDTRQAHIGPGSSKANCRWYGQCQARFRITWFRAYPQAAPDVGQAPASNQQQGHGSSRRHVGAQVHCERVGTGSASCLTELPWIQCHHSACWLMARSRLRDRPALAVQSRSSLSGSNFTHSRPSRLNSSIENDPAARLIILYLVPASCLALTRFHFYWTSRFPRRFAVEAPARGAEPSVGWKGRDAVRRKLSDPLCFCRRHGAAPRPSLVTAECLNPVGSFGYIAAALGSSLLPLQECSRAMLLPQARAIRSIGTSSLVGGSEDVP